MSLRYGHSEGHTDICYSEDFKYIITCGSEGDVRIWDGVDDADQIDNCVGERAWAVCQKGKSLYVATDTNIIQEYTFPTFGMNGIITRFTAPATQIVVSPDGNKLVACSCDMEIHIVDLVSLECKKLSGHSAPVLSVTIDPKGEYVASTSCDGTARIWLLNSGSMVKQWDVVPKSNSFELSTTISRLQFHPDGRMLAIPDGSSIRLYRRETWALQLSLGTPSNNEVFNIIKFSPCGKLIAAGSTGGNIFVWSIQTTSILTKADAEGKSVCGLAWHRSDSIAFVNSNGQLGAVDVPAEQQEDLTSYLNDEEDLGNVPLAEPEFYDDDDDDDENVISLEKLKAETGFGPNGELIKKQDSPVNDMDDRSSVASENFMKAKMPFSELQQPFQPSSTPGHLQQRFMVWNSVGIVRQFNMEDVNDIDVEFHDTSHHHGMRMNNLLGHTMACLTDKQLILGAPKCEDNSSKLVCILLNAWDKQKEWFVSFGDDDILLVAGGEGWAAAVTDVPFLHIFSSDGTQTDIISIPGRPVTMCGNVNSLCVIYHSGVGMNGDQHMSCIEFKINLKTKHVISSRTLPLALSAEASLRWAGFTDQGSLATLDSTGVLRILYKSTWRPVCFLDKQCKSEFDHYFVIGIDEKFQAIRCILCKGAFYPPVTPKPLVTEVLMKIPLCELDSEKTVLEEELLRTSISLFHTPVKTKEALEEKSKTEKSISVIIMKLFALACRSGLDSRAISLCESMTSAEMIRLSAKYASKLGKHQLAEKVNDVANNMSQRVIDEADKAEDVSEDDSQVQKKPNEEESQDMFEENDSAKENIILNMRKKKVLLSPKPFIRRRTGNVFKKNDDNSASSSDANKKAENKVKFMDWYESNRSRLKEEFPLLKESELVMASMKLYKQEIAKKSSSVNELLSSPLDESINITINDTKSSEDTEADTPEPPPEIKKRKLSPEENGSHKKFAPSSKLKAFSFTKR